MQVFSAFHVPMERFFTRRRHNAATKPRWSSGHLPSSDERYTRALCDWVVTLVEPPETLLQAKRPGWWRHGMSLFGGRSAPTDGAETVATLELAKPKRAYHQPSRELRKWWWLARCYATCKDGTSRRSRTTWRHGCRMSSDFGCRRGHCDDGWLRTIRKGENREMLAMCSFTFCERSATVLARHTSRFASL